MKTILVNDNFKENYLENLLYSRGVENLSDFLYPKKENLQDPSFLNNIEEGANLLLSTLENNGKIWTVADCDCDGATSFAILYNYIKKIYPNSLINWSIHEHKEHGLSDWIDELENLNENYDLVLIADASSNDYEFHERLKELGTKVLCIDHHIPDAEISSNCVLINNQISENYINKDLSGAGMAFQFCRYLDQKLNVNYAEDLIDLAALGCCGDMMDIRSIENRYIFTKGFSNIKNPFFKTLVEKQSFSMGDKINYMTVAFYIVPLINAMIRSGTYEEKTRMYEAFINGEKQIESKKRGAKGTLELLCVESVRECTNAKARQDRIVENAMNQLEMKIINNNLLENKILLIELEDEDDFPPEVNGLIATKCAAKYNHPTLIGRKNKEGIIKGSIRGLPNTEMGSFRDFLLSSELFEFVSGHDSAAGWAMKYNNIDKLLNFSNEKLSNFNFNEDIYKVNFMRYAMDSDLSKIIFDLGKNPEIFGQYNPEPLILVKDLNFYAHEITIMGRNQDTVKIIKNGITFIKFRAKEFIKELEQFDQIKLDVVGKVNLNEWNQNITPQIFIEDYNIYDGEFSF